MILHSATDLYMSHYAPDHSSFFSMQASTKQFKDFFGRDIDHSKINTKKVIDFANARRMQVKASTVARNLTTLSSVLTLASTIGKSDNYQNPVHAAKSTPLLKHILKRKKLQPRRVTRENINLLKTGVTENTAKMLPCMFLALELGLRAGELQNIKREDVDFTSKKLHIPVSKNGCSATIPLTKRAYFILKKWDYDFYPKQYKTWVSKAFQLMKRRACKKHPHLKKIRLHDFRHEAIYRMFKKGLNIKEVAIVSRHKDPLILLNYLAVLESDISAKMWQCQPKEIT